MAVKEVKNIGPIEVLPREFAGLAVDTTAWQTANASFPEGSTYKELDTQKIFQLHDGTWYELP